MIRYLLVFGAGVAVTLLVEWWIAGLPTCLRRSEAASASRRQVDWGLL